MVINGHYQFTKNTYISKNRRYVQIVQTPAPSKHANPCDEIVSEGIQPHTPPSILEEENGAAESQCESIEQISWREAEN